MKDTLNNYIHLLQKIISLTHQEITAIENQDIIVLTQLIEMKTPLISQLDHISTDMLNQCRDMPAYQPLWNLFCETLHTFKTKNEILGKLINGSQVHLSKLIQLLFENPEQSTYTSQAQSRPTHHSQMLTKI